MFCFVEYFISLGQALQFTDQFLNVLKFQLNWLNFACLPSLFSLTTGFNVCNQTHRILEKPSAWVASHTDFFSSRLFYPFQRVFCPEAEISWEKVFFFFFFILKNIAILWWLIHAWWKQNDLSQIPDSFVIVFAFNQCLSLEQLYVDLITAFCYCVVLKIRLGSQ